MRSEKNEQVNFRDRNYSTNLEMLGFGEMYLFWYFGVQMVSLRKEPHCYIA